MDRTSRTDATREKFLEHLEKTSNITQSCEYARVPRRTVYEWKEADPEFAAKWEKALVRGVDAMEDEAKRRAFTGYDEPVYQGGRQVGEIRRYSDTLATLLLKAHAPEKYRERTDMRVSGTLDVRAMSDAALEAEIAEAAAAGLVDGADDKA